MSAAEKARTGHLLRSSLIVITLFGVGKLTGLLRSVLVGQAFGTTATYDAFVAANQLPEVFFVVISGGSLAAAFIPVYAGYLDRQDRADAARLANTILTLVFMLLGLLSTAGALLAPWLTRTFLVPEFAPETQQLTAELMRILLLQTLLFGVSGVFSSVLYAHQHFATPALADITIDVGYFAGLFLLAPLGIRGLAWGTVIGAGLQILVQMPALIRYGYRLQPALAMRLRGVREIGVLMGPRVVTLGVVQLADLFIVNLASGLPPGSTSGYNYGYALMQLPETLFGTAIALVVFPTMAELYNQGRLAALQETFAATLGIIWTLTIPSAALLVWLGEPAIGLLLQRGAFTAASTALVYSILLAFSVRVVSEATLEMVARLFYARHNTRTPMLAYLGWLLLQVALAAWWVRDLGVVGLALAATVAFTALAAALFWLNRRALGGLHERRLAASAARAVAATAAMSVVIWGVRQVVPGRLPFVALAGVLGVGTYVVVHLAVGGREIPGVWKLMRRR